MSNGQTEPTRSPRAWHEREAAMRFRTWLRTDAAPRWIMAGLLVIGAFLRLTNLNWDEFTHIHPDERFLTMVTSAMDLPSSLRQFLDSSQSPMNPYNIGYDFFVYGTLPLFIVRIVAEFAQKFNEFAQIWQSSPGIPIMMTGYDGVHLVGRFMSGLFDLGVVWLVYVIGRRLHNVRVGLLAAAFYTFAVLALQQSHFYTVDTFATFFAALTFYFAVRVAQGADPARRSGWATYVALGASLGASLACRINLVPMAVIALLATGIRAWDDWQRLATSNSRQTQPGTQESPLVLGPLLFQATFFRWLLLILMAIAVFRTMQPYSFGGTGLLDFSFAPDWLANMRDISRTVKLDIESPPAHSWANQTRFVFPFFNMVVWGMGIPLGVTAWTGWAVAVLQIVRGLTVRPAPEAVKAHLLPAAWIGGMFLYHSMQFSYTMRYYLPIYPMLALLAAWLLFELSRPTTWSSLRRALCPRSSIFHLPSSMRAAPSSTFNLQPVTIKPGYALIALVTVATMLWGWGFLAIYRRPMTRIAASRWIYENVPQGSRLGVETWDEIVPLDVDGKSAFSSQYFAGLSSGDGGLMAMHWEDVPEKREALYRWLDEADYLVISSNRRWATAPRMPMRFPMTIEYYKRLFAGQLGFQPVLHAYSFPTIAGIQLRDTSAEEAFSVYDHPEVFVFRKTSAYSAGLVRSYLEPIDLEHVLPMTSKQVTQAPTALLLTPDEAEAQAEGGTWSEIFDLDSAVNRSPLLSVLVWLFLVLIIGWAAFPLLFAVLRPLPDRGYGVAKTAGLLLLAWLSWFGPALKLTSYSKAWIAICLGLLIGVSAVTAWRQRAALGRFIRARRGLLLAEEGVFLAFFGLFLLIRIGNPDLWHLARGGEKPMEFAYLNAVIRSTTFPPYDPWHAGGYMNYYYFGWVLVATLTKLAGIVPWVAYNLAVPTFFALTGVGAFSVAFGLSAGDRTAERPMLRRDLPDDVDSGPVEGEGARDVAAVPAPAAIPAAGTGAAGARPWVAGLAGAILVAVIGNLGNLKLLLDELGHRGTVVIESSIPGLARLVSAASGAINVLTNKATLEFPNDWWFWNASRVIPDTINEFPFFTFVYADLHAHMMALPLTLLALAAIVALAMHVPRPAGLGGEPPVWAVPLPELALLLLLGFVIGALRATNTWDFPTYALAAAAALVVLEASRRGHGRPHRAAPTVHRPGDTEAWLAFGVRAVASVLWRLVIVVAVGSVAFYPFTSNYATAYAGLELYKDGKTAIGDYLTHWGFFIALAIVYLLAELAAQRREDRLPGWLSRAAPGLIGFLVVLLGLGWLMGVRVWLVALPLLALAALLALGRELPAARRMALLLLALALAITMGVEVLRQKDDIGRMNTVFKFGLQAWTLFGVSLAYGLASFAERSARGRIPWSKVAWAGLALLFAGTMLYPPFAARAKMRDRFSADASPRGLDGMAYMDRAQYFDNGRELRFADDKAAMLWLMRNVQGTPAILEAQIPEYRWGSRFSVYTGLPAVQGWNWHQRQQRSVTPGEVVERRVRHVAEMYNTTDLDRARSLLDHYGVSYIVVGELERAYYSAEGLEKFERLRDAGYLQAAYQGGAVTVYEVVAVDRSPAGAAATFLLPRFGAAEAEGPVSPLPFESPPAQ